MFYEISGERFREVFKCEDGSWLVSFDHPLEPRFVIKEDMERLTRILPPAEYVRNKEKEPTMGQRKRIELLEGIVDDPECIMDRDKRNEKIRESAKENHTTVRRLQMLYYRALAGRPLVEERVLPPKEETQEQKDFSWAIDEFYFSAKKMSHASLPLYGSGRPPNGLCSFVVFLQALLLWEELPPKIPEYDCQEWTIRLSEKQTASLWERV